MKFQDFIEEYQKVPVEEYPNNVLEKVPSPLVSCRVSTYQHSPYIRQCLDGILMQKTNFPLEIVIGEDESSDGTREICIEYAKKYPDIIRLFLHKRENNMLINGKPSSKFQGTYTMFQLRGKYQAICEGDDYWTDPYKLQKQVDFLEQNSDYTVCCHAFKAYDNEKGIFKPSIRQRKPFVKGNFSFNHLDLIGWSVQPLTIVFRSSTLQLFSLSCYRFSRDIHLEYHLLKEGKGYFIDESMGVYRHHEFGIYSKTSDLEKSLMRYKIFNEMHLINNDIYTATRYFSSGISLSKHYLSQKQWKLSTEKLTEALMLLFNPKFSYVIFNYYCRYIYFYFRINSIIRSQS
jgi:glycosyltransferase involved in cell wall biosynthesis